jgi:intracellular sulfur oxidation DsrE/DsrF family protein
MNDYKVIFHVNEQERMNIAIGNIVNLIKDVMPVKPEAELVVNGSAIVVFGDKAIGEQMRNLNDQGVKIIACRNSIRMFCKDNPECPIAEDKLPSFVKVVSAGVTEIIKKQHDGYAYIKP